MALPELLRALEREAVAEIAALREAARADADRLRADVAHRRDARIRAELDRHAATERALRDAEVAAVSRRARAAVLEARAAALERLRAAVVEALPAVLDDRLRDTLMSAARAIAGDDATYEPTPTGVRATRGTMVVEATLEAILARLWPRLRLEATP